jgi:hypothetical protein
MFDLLRGPQTYTYTRTYTGAADPRARLRAHAPDHRRGPGAAMDAEYLRPPRGTHHVRSARAACAHPTLRAPRHGRRQHGGRPHGQAARDRGDEQCPQDGPGEGRHHEDDCGGLGVPSDPGTARQLDGLAFGSPQLGLLSVVLQFAPLWCASLHFNCFTLLHFALLYFAWFRFGVRPAFFF